MAGRATSCSSHPPRRASPKTARERCSTRSGSTVARAPDECCELPNQVVPIGVRLVRADQVWGEATGNGVTVGFIDDGYKVAHEDLYPIASSHCKAGAEEENCMDGGWHGTLVAGVAVARNNTVGVVGAAPGVLENAYWCLHLGTSDDATCIGWLVSRGVRIINMSWGGPQYDETLANAVAQAYDIEERLLVSIANNRDSLDAPPEEQYPASYEEVIGVSGAMPDSQFASGPHGVCIPDGNPPDTLWVTWGNASNYGHYVELSAPFFTLTTAPTSQDQEHDYLYVCGTSFAAPHVAAVAALVWEKNPQWTAVEVREHLRATARDLGSSGWDPYYGYGLVDAYAAVIGDEGEPPGEPPPGGPPDGIDVSIVGPWEVPADAGEACSWSAFVTGQSGPVSYTWRWNQQIVGYNSFLVSFEDTPGWYYLEVTAWDTSSSDSDGRWVEVVNQWFVCD